MGGEERRWRGNEEGGKRERADKADKKGVVRLLATRITNYLQVLALAIGPDGKRIVSGSWDESVIVWSSPIISPSPIRPIELTLYSTVDQPYLRLPHLMT